MSDPSLHPLDLSQASESTMDGILLLEDGSFALLDANASWLAMFGYDRPALAGLTIAEVVVEPQRLLARIRRGARDVPQALGSTHWRRQDGSTFGANYSLGAFSLGGREVITVAVHGQASPTDEPYRLRQLVERAARQHATLIHLEALDELDFDRRLREILEADADTLEVGRVSFWSLADADTLDCEALYLRGEARFEGGARLYASDYPTYFEALRRGAIVAAASAATDPHTRELARDRLEPLGIGSMLTAPVKVRGALVGLVCHEHVGGDRSWSIDERKFATAIAQMVSLALEYKARDRAERALRQSEARFRAIVESAPIPMIVLTFPEGICIYANAAASELFGVPYDELVGQRSPDFYENPQERQALLAQLVAGASVRNMEIRLRRADGSGFWAMLSIHRLWFDDQAALVVGALDVSEQKLMQEALRHVALHDNLTGLPNRALFVDMLAREMAHVRREPERGLAVLFVDLDDFKCVNDTYGHEAGDKLLMSIAGRLRACLRPRDVVGRMGGDEFTMLLSDVSDENEALRITERVEAVLRVPHEIAGQQVASAASIGLVLYVPSRHSEPGQLLREADAAMYRAKERGKAHVELFVPEPDEPEPDEPEPDEPEPT